MDVEGGFLTSKRLSLHARSPQVLEQLAEAVPVMQRHMTEIEAQAPMPAEAIPAAQVGASVSCTCVVHRLEAVLPSRLGGFELAALVTRFVGRFKNTYISIRTCTYAIHWIASRMPEHLAPVCRVVICLISLSSWLL